MKYKLSPKYSHTYYHEKKGLRIYIYSNCIFRINEGTLINKRIPMALYLLEFKRTNLNYGKNFVDFQQNQTNSQPLCRRVQRLNLSKIFV